MKKKRKKREKRKKEKKEKGRKEKRKRKRREHLFLAICWRNHHAGPSEARPTMEMEICFVGYLYDL